LVDPITLSAGIACYHAAKQGIGVVKELLETAEDISTVSGAISNILTHAYDLNDHYNNHKRLKAEADAKADPNSDPVPELQEAIDLVLHRRQLAEDLQELEISLCHRFPNPPGEPTIWEVIKKEHSDLRKKKILQRRELARIRAEEAAEAAERRKKWLIEGAKILTLILAVCGIGYFLLMAYEKGPIR